MSQWQITDQDGVAVDTFDDGIFAAPGEEGFTTDHVRAHVAERGEGFGFNYMGRSTLVSENTEPEIEQAVEAIIETLPQPELPPKPTKGGKRAAEAHARTVERLRAEHQERVEARRASARADVLQRFGMREEKENG